VSRAWIVLALAGVAACRIERTSSGRPAGPPTAADSIRRVEEDSADVAAVTTVLREYYSRLSARDWRALRRSFWPGGTITTIWTPPGERAERVFVQTIDQFIRAAPSGPGRLAVFSEEMVRPRISLYGPLAEAWVVYRARFGATPDSVRIHHGVDAFHLMRHDGEWRIVTLTFTGELPGRPLAGQTDP
jgi:hypothetical protein